MSLRHTFVPAACLVILSAAVMVMLRAPAESATLEMDTVRTEGVERAHQVLSKTYEVDRKYRSMMGPWSQQKIFLAESEEPELLWITGYKAVMVGEDGEKAMPQEFMCHSNLDINPSEHMERFRGRKAISGRLFTLSQGQFDIQLPQGFGIPLMSDEPLNLTTQVLNLNHEDRTFQVRHKVTVEFVRDRDVEGSMRPLFPSGVYGLVSLEGRPLHFGIPGEEGSPAQESSHSTHAGDSGAAEHGGDPALAEAAEGGMGPGCMIGQNAAQHEYQDPLGQRFTGHWVVEPGREENRTLVTKILNLPFDTRVHYIAVHLHPFAESLELVDLTRGTTVFKSHVRPAEKGIGIDHVEYFSSPEGLQLYEDHDYELVSVYNNTSGEAQDSMAVMYLYLADVEFERPAAAQRAAVER